MDNLHPPRCRPYASITLRVTGCAEDFGHPCSQLRTLTDEVRPPCLLTDATGNGGIPCRYARPTTGHGNLPGKTSEGEHRAVFDDGVRRRQYPRREAVRG